MCAVITLYYLFTRDNRTVWFAQRLFDGHAILLERSFVLLMELLLKRLHLITVTALCLGELCTRLLQQLLIASQRLVLLRYPCLRAQSHIQTHRACLRCSQRSTNQTKITNTAFEVGYTQRLAWPMCLTERNACPKK